MTAAKRSVPALDETDLGIEVAERTNVCAIVGLLCALTGLFIPALVFGAIGYVETGGREHETGSGLAVAALIVGAIELIAVVLTIVLAVFFR